MRRLHALDVKTVRTGHHRPGNSRIREVVREKPNDTRDTRAETIRDVRFNREEKGGTVSGEDVLPEASGARDERREEEVRERNGWGCRA